MIGREKIKAYSIFSHKLLAMKFLLLFFSAILIIGHVSAQKSGSISTDLHHVFKPERIKEDNYKIVIYSQDNDTVSNVKILDRRIIREKFKGIRCIKITEISGNNRTNVYMDAKSLAPRYFESFSGDTLMQKAEFENTKETITDIKNGIEKRTEVEISPTIFFSNCFSELVQSNDFKINPSIEFETFNPGKPSNHFIVEKTGEKVFSLLGKKIDCWILKFTRMDTSGNKVPAGFRYIDKSSGKVLMFKTDIASNKFFAYQTIFLE